ncbi:hypothetical protein BpHYR1_006795 [Brachionus plicatilis]|uniref:Uncharacterized protein n=1 Tax=Brachionus plicatilis TaxID=10195 RepID=A0A3M7S9J6_BRAPC|nr:hypothetical protein BpHYR1_006795 [Brachionus plicatilis]
MGLELKNCPMTMLKSTFSYPNFGSNKNILQRDKFSQSSEPSLADKNIFLKKFYLILDSKIHSFSINPEKKITCSSSVDELCEFSISLNLGSSWEINFL